MPEYLTPGVYVEEVSFRSKSIEGVATSTTGFVVVSRFGPVRHAGGPLTNKPRLVTSFTEYESIYGGIEPLNHGASSGGGERINYSAHAARAFFLNGGKRLYCSRVFRPDATPGVASLTVPVGATSATWTARWPGSAGNVRIQVEAVRSKNVADTSGAVIQAKQARHGAIVEVGAALAAPTDPLVAANLREVRVDPVTGTQEFFNAAGGLAPPAAGDVIALVELRVSVRVNGERTDVYDRLAVHPEQKRFIWKILNRDYPEQENSTVWIDWNHVANESINLMVALFTGADTWVGLTGGDDGLRPRPVDLAGQEADVDNPLLTATGLAALGEIRDIAIVAMPDGSTYPNTDDVENRAAMDALIGHAERERFRIAVVDGPQNASLTRIRNFRAQFDSTYGALYHPWIETLDPTQRPSQGAPPDRLVLPPSGFVAGIYARTDINRGVFKAPANETVRGLTKFEANINDGRQAVINPEGINALRFLDGRGNRVWGARTMTSDPEWKYVPVRRLFIFLEHSIFNGTQWAVFEPNNERLWANVRQTVSDFLYTLWLEGALMGTKPEQAFFVRCDRTTMSQNDLDNGRLICLIGVAPAKPAEFVIFRVGQWTGDAA